MRNHRLSLPLAVGLAALAALAPAADIAILKSTEVLAWRPAAVQQRRARLQS